VTPDIFTATHQAQRSSALSHCILGVQSYGHPLTAIDRPYKRRYTNENFILKQRFSHLISSQVSRDSSVGIATDYGADDRMIGVRFPSGSGNFSLRHRVQTDSGVHPATYPVDTGGSSPGVKRPGREADHSSPSSAEVKECISKSFRAGRLERELQMVQLCTTRCSCIAIL
jgi:hypothetical protein